MWIDSADCHVLSLPITGAFDVAYLLGTSMCAADRAQFEQKVLRRYLRTLGSLGVDTKRYSFEQLETDYSRGLYATAALYAIPNVYDRGTETQGNTTAAIKVRAVLRRNLQPVLDDDEFVARVHDGL